MASAKPAGDSECCAVTELSSDWSVSVNRRSEASGEYFIDAVKYSVTRAREQDFHPGCSTSKQWAPWVCPMTFPITNATSKNWLSVHSVYTAPTDRSGSSLKSKALES